MYHILIKKKAPIFIDKLPINEKKRIVFAIEQFPNGHHMGESRTFLSRTFLFFGNYLTFSNENVMI